MQQLYLFNDQIRPLKRPRRQPQEFKVIALRDCPTPDNMRLCDTPKRAVDYWRLHVSTQPWFDSERESLVVLLLNTRKRVKGHHLVSIGTLDTSLAHSREVFRAAIIAAAHGIILTHNHPSGESLPSDSDIRITRELVRAGNLLKISVIDHIIVGHRCHTSLRELGLVSP